ncbi:MAG: 16S rRNA (guanine(527)-N(7))-methyltransferase RsmG [Nitrospirae bacterium]|nr:16S rRNA (guanine(527)-N(7))-methyltransferase RsmG [Nitrospirota bacterium]
MQGTEINPKQEKANILITKGLREIGITVMPKQVSSFISYLSLIKKWQKAYSLTSLKTDEDIVIKHFLDSCLYLKALPEGSLSLADVGSGAGFPGIPIKIMRPELNVYLIEPSKKKSAFLRHTIRALGLKGITVIEQRVEDMKNVRFDIAVTRALWSINEFIAKASPIVKDRGILVISKGPKVKEEIGEIRVDYEMMPAKLPLSQAKRYLVIIRNV